MHVYISHSHADKRAVHRIVDDLKRNGVSVLLDDDLLSPGESWAVKLGLAIAGSDIVIVAISRNTAVSQWQTSEIAFAVAAQKSDKHKRVIPVLLDKGADIPFFLKSIVYCDLSDENAYKQNFAQLIQAMSRPNTDSLITEEVDRIHLLKSEKLLLELEKDALSREMTIRKATVLHMVSISTCIFFILFGGYLVHSEWGSNLQEYTSGIATGILSILTALFAFRIHHIRANHKEGKNGHQ